MKILVDEAVPVQLTAPLRTVLDGHEVDHVELMNWKANQ